jgi:hypothetical protein
MIKGILSQESQPSNFSTNSTPWALVRELKLFRIWLRIGENIRLQKSTLRYAPQRGVNF